MTNLQLWIDADACPVVVKEIIFKAAARLGLPVRMVANKPLYTPPQAGVSLVVVSAGLNVADDYIADNVGAGDIVITADIPLGARLVEKGAVGISPHGRIMDQNTITEMLSIRDLSEEFRSAGGFTGGPQPFDDKARRAFANAFDKTLTKALKRSGHGG